MRRDVHLAMVAFWTGAPLFAVYLAASWPQLDLGWPVLVLWIVVVASSAYLTVRYSSPLVEEGHGGLRHRRASEALVYPITLCLACMPFALQVMDF